MQHGGSFGGRVGFRTLVGVVAGALAWYPLGRWLFDLSVGLRGPVERGLPEIVRFLALASVGFEVVALAGMVGYMVLTRSDGSIGAAVVGMSIPGSLLAAAALSLPPGQGLGILALVSPVIACFCSALASAWHEVAEARARLGS